MGRFCEKCFGRFVEPTLIRLAYDNVTGTNLALPDIYDATCLTTYPIPVTNGWLNLSTTASPSSTYSASGAIVMAGRPRLEVLVVFILGVLLLTASIIID
jgi:hypothetical protein